MNYSYGASASENFNSNHGRLIETYGNECYLRNKSLYEASNSHSHNPSENLINHHQFDCLISETGVNVDTIANENKTDDDILQSSVSSSSNSSSSSFSYNMSSASHRFNHSHHHNHNHHHQQQHNDLQHQLNQQNMLQTNTNNLDYSFSGNNSLNNSFLANKKLIKQDATLNDTNYTSEKSQTSFSNDSKFQYVLLAPTSPAVKTNEDTLTYLNQGQNYELRLSLTDPLSINNSVKTFDSNGRQDKQNSNYMEDIKPLIINGKPNMNMNENNAQNKYILNDSTDNKTYPVYLSIIRLCFWDRKLQESEHREIKEWEKEYQNVRMLEIDGNSSYGTVDVRVSEMYTNAAEIIWNGNTGASIFFRCNCTSTAFAPHKHGGEKGIHMRFQIDTFEFNSNFVSNNNNKNGNSSLSINCNQTDLQSSSSTSILSPPNSASSPIQTHKFNVKEDIDQNVQRLPTPSSLTDYSNWVHSCSSYCRIQLFRLKGAQRKLKTDRNKIEKLNPSDLRRRYQPSSKITLLYNGPFDPLYSMMPPLICNQIEHGHRHYYQPNMSYHEKSSIENHGLNGGNLPLSGSVMGSVDYMRNTLSANALTPTSSSFHLNNSISPQPTVLYNSPGYVPGLQPYLVSPSHQHQAQIVRSETNDNIQQPHLTTLTNVQYNQSQPNSNQINEMESSFTPSSIASSDEPQMSHHFYFDSNNQSHYKLQMPEIVIQSNSYTADANNSFGDDQTYSRFKRKSSMSFTANCSNINIPLTLSNTSPHSYQTNNLNLNQSNSCRSKQQKTNSTSLSQSGVAVASSPIQASVMSSNYNNVSSQNYSLTNKSSSSSLSSLSTSSSPISPNVTPLRNQPDLEINNHNKNQISTESDLSLMANSIQNSHHHSHNHHVERPMPLNSSSYLKTQSFSLQPDCSYKYVQEWIFANRFSHLIHLFSNYASNDVLRLSKDDLIKLCGAPDGIRLFNLAHNIQIKSKITIFITFQSCLTYFSAIFMADWNCKSLVKRLTLLYSSFVRNINGDQESKLNKLSIKDEQIIENNSQISPNNIYAEDDDSENDDDENSESHSNKKNEDDIVYGKQISTDEKKSQENQEHLHLFDKMLSSEYNYELFIKLKGILVKTTDEVLNNLTDQSRFLIQFEPAHSNTHQETLKITESTKNKVLLDKNNLIKIIMIPLN